jgi:hypothetical protein
MRIRQSDYSTGDGSTAGRVGTTVFVANGAPTVAIGIAGVDPNPTSQST